MLCNGQNKKLCSKRFLVPLLAILILGTFYLGIDSHKKLTRYLMNITTLFIAKNFGGQGLHSLQTQAFFHIDEQKWRLISMYEIFERHKSRTSASCDNDCNVKNDMGCAATSLESWQKTVLSPQFTFMPLLSDFEYIYPFEVDYLSYPPLTDSKQLPSLTLSKVYLEGSGSGQVLCAVGDTLQGRVDLVDGYGKQRTMGGDEVRVWMVDQQTKKYRAMGHVMDMKNGSYQISVRCLWSGKSQLNVAVVYPREYLRVVIQQIHKGVTRSYAVKFKRQNIEEITVCLATPNIPGRSCVCNFTLDNQQSLYCGRPLDARLSCDNWVQTFALPLSQIHDVTPAEAQLVKAASRNVSESTISHNITIVVNTGQLPKLKPCSATSPSETWEIGNRPRGYWTPSKDWQSLICQSPKMTKEWTASCLRNSSVWVFGDSNGVRLSDAISALIKAKRNRTSWPYQYINLDKVNAITVTFTPLEYPLYLGTVWRPRLPYGGVAKQIDKIPSSGTHFLVIHYYLHITPSHLSIAYLRLSALHDAIQRLVDRNPNVVVGIRGPHVSSIEYNHNHAVGGDNLGTHLLEMIRQVFADLRHKVVLLDGWEMSVALENSWMHPDDIIPYQLARTMLAFKCT